MVNGEVNEVRVFKEEDISMTIVRARETRKRFFRCNVCKVPESGVERCLEIFSVFGTIRPLVSERERKPRDEDETKQM